jgi:hypothetical protein
MINDRSDCLQHFGYKDFDLTRLKQPVPDACPITGCSQQLVEIPYRGKKKPFCPKHGIRLHSRTFVYWNGEVCRDQARLRNFQIRPDLARNVALGSVGKAESHRLGYEMSEDALSWNVFVGLAEAGMLRQAIKVLCDRDVTVEPNLYLWGELVDVRGGRRQRFLPLDAVRNRLEPDINGFKTEPDIMLVVEGQIIVCIEAKFGSGNTVAFDGTVKKGEKPVGRQALLARYLPEVFGKQFINRDAIGEQFHSQLFRNIVFASAMADGKDWHVVNLVSRTQAGKTSKRSDFGDPCEYVRSYLDDDHKQCFTFRTWEALHGALFKDLSRLTQLDSYFRSKSAHYRQAFTLE